jgi:hypothetical protein
MILRVAVIFPDGYPNDLHTRSPIYDTTDRTTGKPLLGQVVHLRRMQNCRNSSGLVAEASGSRTHQRHKVPLNGFEARAQHRPKLASTAIVANGNRRPARSAG